ncbi:unnamed protein product [Trichogramma brassicae]|uniref:RNA-directed DNA polymerase n=1 Tax=Trichogramma brassicae TaxID=86971 RepID=A0A6H5IQN8_9HYME|nr:unnamed protein product [Trichogramma brassicae]
MPEMQKVYVQLLQHLAYRSTTFFSCRVIVSRVIRYCGAFSHSKIVQGGDSRSWKSDANTVAEKIKLSSSSLHKPGAPEMHSRNLRCKLETKIHITPKYWRMSMCNGSCTGLACCAEPEGLVAQAFAQTCEMKFTVVTDHQALVHFSKTRKPDLRFNRLKAELRGYEFDIVYRRGLVNSNVDALSRNPVIRQGDDITELPRAQLYELADKQEEETNVLEEEKDHPPGRNFKVRARREKKKKALMTEGRKSGDEKVKSDDGLCSGSDMLRQPHIKMRRTKSPSSCSVCSTSDSDVSIRAVSGPRKAQLRAKEKIANIIQSTRRPRAHAETSASPVHQAQSTQTRSANKVTSPIITNEQIAETQNAHDVSHCKATISCDKSAHMSDVMRPSPSYASQSRARLPDTARANDTSISSSGGHRGINGTLKKLAGDFYWRNMRPDVHSFVKRCNICQTEKVIRVKTKLPMAITDTPSKPFDKISMDFYGPLKHS